MKRRSPASITNPLPIGATCTCALTAGVRPMLDAIIRIARRIAHFLRAGVPRHVNSPGFLLMTLLHQLRRRGSLPAATKSLSRSSDVPEPSHLLRQQAQELRPEAARRHTSPGTAFAPPFERASARAAEPPAALNQRVCRVRWIRRDRRRTELSRQPLTNGGRRGISSE